MPMHQVAELARQAANDDGVMRALQSDPARIRIPFNLSEPQLRALISAGSFTTARPAMTTSVPGYSLASQIATMDTDALFPPEGQGAFPTPGELPPGPTAAPVSAPVASPVAGIAPHPLAPVGGPVTPMQRGPAPQIAAPTHGAPRGVSPGTPMAPIGKVAPSVSGSPYVPVGAVMSPGTPVAPVSPVAPLGAAPAGPCVPADGGSATPPGLSGGSGMQAGTEPCAAVDAGQLAGCVADAPSSVDQPSYVTCGPSAVQGSHAYPVIRNMDSSAECCDAQSIAMIAIVAQLSTTAQAGITAITAIAGLS